VDSWRTISGSGGDINANDDSNNNRNATGAAAAGAAAAVGSVRRGAACEEACDSSEVGDVRRGAGEATCGVAPLARAGGNTGEEVQLTHGEHAREQARGHQASSKVCDTAGISRTRKKARSSEESPEKKVKKEERKKARSSKESPESFPEPAQKKRKCRDTSERVPEDTVDPLGRTHHQAHRRTDRQQDRQEGRQQDRQEGRQTESAGWDHSGLRVEKGREAGRVPATLADGGRQAAPADARTSRMPDVRACNAGAESVAAAVQALATCGQSKCKALRPSAPSAPTSLSPKISNLCQTADDAYNAGAL
jgi:hypothetical protein